MRDVKFRAWDGDMWYMENEEDWIKFYGGGYIKGEFTSEEGGSCIDFKEDRSELMQYTGLKDKNGVEIYEGDIIERHSDCKVVEWIGGDEQDWQGWDIEQVFGKWKVIGNIYENPELLE